MCFFAYAPAKTCVAPGPATPRCPRLSHALVPGGRYHKNSQFNFFGEKHGKSPCDAHFGALAGYHERYSSVVGDIRTPEDVIKAFEWGHAEAPTSPREPRHSKGRGERQKRQPLSRLGVRALHGGGREETGEARPADRAALDHALRRDHAVRTPHSRPQRNPPESFRARKGQRVHGLSLCFAFGLQEPGG